MAEAGKQVSKQVSRKVVMLFFLPGGGERAQEAIKSICLVVIG